MSANKEHTIGEGMFVMAILGLIVGQIITGCLGVKGFTISFICTIIGAIFPLFSKE